MAGAWCIGRGCVQWISFLSFADADRPLCEECKAKQNDNKEK